MGLRTNGYAQFLSNKRLRSKAEGFEPLWVPDFLFDFQKYLVEWSIRQGRCAIFADCGLGKTPLALVWAENVVRKTNGNVLILTPLAVSHQFVREGEKFGIEVKRSAAGKPVGKISVTNYERLAKFDPQDYIAVIADESSILKNFEGKTRQRITQFMQGVKYRLLDTATPAPNDHMELGTSSEALGLMTKDQMLGTFFTVAGNQTSQWIIKGHAKKRFWQWMATWSRAVRKPSDLGFEDGDFELPELNIEQHVLPSNMRMDGLFARKAATLNEQREERRLTIKERCQKVADLVPSDRPCVVWCHLNDEGDYLENIIPGAVQVAGRHKDEVKEERLKAFSDGSIRVIVTKPSIAGWGLNWQHCSDMTFFPSHSWEQWYQAVRRCWRFGQQRDVNVHVVTTERESGVLKNLLRKEKQASEMYSGIVREMNKFVSDVEERKGQKMEVPAWL